MPTQGRLLILRYMGPANVDKIHLLYFEFSEFVIYSSFSINKN
jgi:hypothetical protein